MKAVIPGKKPGKNPTQTPKQTFKDDFVFIVDASGSMGSRGKRDEAERGVNNFLDEQQQVGQGAVTIVLFHSGLPGKMKTLARKVGLDQIRLNRSNYRLGNTTPLYECATKVIEGYETDSDSVTVIIATDGIENDSHHSYTKARLSALIRTKEAQGWNFIFLGQDIDAKVEGAKVGVKSGTTAQTNSYERALRRTSAKVTEYRQTRNAERLVYTEDDRAAMS